MPQKEGNGGYGLERYDPNTGKYMIDGVTNKSYDNPEEKKILNSMGLEKEDITSNGKLFSKHIMATSFPEYYIEILEKFNNSIEDSIYKDILLNYIQQKDAIVHFRNISTSGYSSSRNEIVLGNYVYENEDYYWTYFHEEGHSIDRNYENNQYLSDEFVGSCGKTLLQCLIEDGNQNKEQLFLEYKNHEEEIIKKIFNEKGLGEFKTYEQLKKEFENDKESRILEIENQKQNLLEKAQKMIEGKNEIEQEEISNSKEAIQMIEEYNNLEQEKYDLSKQDFKDEEDFLMENKEYAETLLFAKREASKDYRCLSDIASGLFKERLNIFYHPNDY